MNEMGQVEDDFASRLEDYRLTLKSIRNTESSVQPSRDHKQKLTDQIAHLKYKDPESPKLVQLEQELVRAEAENLVAEAQLSNMTRTKLKEAFALHFAAVVERSQKSEILAKHGRNILELLDDSPVVPGETNKAYDGDRAAREILMECEDELKQWKPFLEPVETADLQQNSLPAADSNTTTSSDLGSHNLGATIESTTTTTERVTETTEAV